MYDVIGQMQREEGGKKVTRGMVGVRSGRNAGGSAYAFRQLVAAVIVHPRGKGEPYTIQIKGYLSNPVDSALSAKSLVAEEGFEPPTQGL